MIERSTKRCGKCELDIPIADYYKTKKRIQSYCKKCFNQTCSDRWIQTKFRAFEYKGGKCVDCNTVTSIDNYVIFDFHHVDALDKEFNWTKGRIKSWNSITKELDKCVLICSNCHRMRHHTERINTLP